MKTSIGDSGLLAKDEPTNGVGDGHLIVDGQLHLPRSINTLAAFREWAYRSYPEHGLVAFLGGDLWVDMTMEKFITHNQVKAAVSFGIMQLLQQHAIGRFVPDRMLWSNVLANLSTEPDGLFYTWETMRSGKLHLTQASDDDSLELEETPDMVLEVVSATSVHKDTVRLRELYWRAGVNEYWLVDARGKDVRFYILCRTAEGYIESQVKNGWVKSAVFDHEFWLVRDTDPLGQPIYSLEAQRNPEE